MTPEGFDSIHVSLRGKAAGAITKADIERRARELALIRAGTPDYSTQDLAAAESELLGARDPDPTTEDAHPPGTASRDTQYPSSDDGERPEMMIPEDENTSPEKLALQGVEEAQHDLMVGASEEVTEESRDTESERNQAERPISQPEAPAAYVSGKKKKQKSTGTSKSSKRKST